MLGAIGWVIFWVALWRFVYFSWWLSGLSLCLFYVTLQHFTSFFLVPLPPPLHASHIPILSSRLQPTSFQKQGSRSQDASYSSKSQVRIISNQSVSYHYSSLSSSPFSPHSFQTVPCPSGTEANLVIQFPRHIPCQDHKEPASCSSANTHVILQQTTDCSYSQEGTSTSSEESNIRLSACHVRLSTAGCSPLECPISCTDLEGPCRPSSSEEACPRPSSTCEIHSSHEHQYEHQRSNEGVSVAVFVFSSFLALLSNCKIKKKPSLCRPCIPCLAGVFSASSFLGT